MAWKRGTQNNPAGEIRKGHIKEFLQKSSKATGVVGKLHIVSMSSMPSLFSAFGESYFALVSTESNGLPPQFAEHVKNNMLLLHAHEHPRVVLSALLHPDVPPGSIVMNEIQCLNSKVCTGEHEDWTVYVGDHFAYDGREGAIGATDVKVVGDKSICFLRTMSVAVRPRFVPTLDELDDDGDDIPTLLCDAVEVAKVIQKNMYDCVISCDEIFQVTVPSINGHSSQLVCRVSELEEDAEGNDEEEVDEEHDIDMPDCHRGRITAETAVYLTVEGSTEVFELINNVDKPSSAPLTNVVTILTADEEEFFVKRRLLRPCIALTSVVQAGRGKYQGDSAVSTSEPIQISVGACTFDRVLLYLEHEAREEEFKFDPLIAPELLAAAETLNVLGLQEICQKVLGSFKERVRHTAIPLEEVFQRNARGHELSLPPPQGVGKRGETLLIMSGMIFDITRWLEEHPGGSTIIPEQALNMDCTSFFEIYHASRQAFLYLKEFYIGELSEEDLRRVPLPPGEVPPSAAFLEQLKRVTPWRLKREDVKQHIFVHKSF